MSTPKSLSNSEMEAKLKARGITPSWQASSSATTKSPAVSQPQGGLNGLNFVNNALKAVGNFGIGVLKGVGSTVTSVGDLGTKTLGRIVGAQDIEGTSEMVRSAQEDEGGLLHPEGTAQKVGFMTEQVSEFLVPGGAVAKGAKALEATAAVSKAGKLGKTVAKLAPQVGADVGVALGQSGGDLDEAATAGAFSVGGGLVGHIAAQGLKNLGNAIFLRTVPGTPSQLARDIAKGIDIGEALSKTGISLTKNQLMGKVANRINKFTNATDELVSGVGENVSRSFDEVANDAQKLLEDKEIAKVLEATPIDIESAKQVVNDTLNKYRELYAGKTLTAAEQHQLKQDIGVGLGRIWDKTLGTPIRAQAFAEKKIYNALNNFLRSNVEGYEALNKQLAPLREASKRATQKGAYSGYLTDVIAAGMAGANPSDILTDPMGFFQDALMGVLVKRAAFSTASKTAFGTLIKKLGESIDTPAFYQLLRELTSSDQAKNEPNVQN